MSVQFCLSHRLEKILEDTFLSWEIHGKATPFALIIDTNDLLEKQQKFDWKTVSCLYRQGVVTTMENFKLVINTSNSGSILVGIN